MTTLPKPSITAQRQAVEILLRESFEIVTYGATIEAANEALRTLAWIERNPCLARAVAVLMREFPDAEISR